MITAQDFTGNPLQGVTINAEGSNTTIPDQSWFTTIFGIDLGSTPLTSTEMTGTTGSDGATTFLMLESEEYTIQFLDPSRGINETHTIYPSQSSYTYMFWTSAQSAVVPPSQRISVGLWNAPNGTDPSYTDLGAYYSDASGSTNNLTFRVQSEYGANVSVQYLNPAVSQNVSYRVLRQRGAAYIWSISGNTTAYNRPVGQSNLIRFPGSPVINFDLNKRDVNDNTVGIDWNSYISLAIIFVMALLFGRASIKYAMAVIPLMTLFFWWIRLLTGLLQLLMAFIVFVGIVFYLRFAEQESDV
jgi:hypothetical protein